MKKEFVLFGTYIILCVALVTSCEKESKEMSKLSTNSTSPPSLLSIGQNYGGGVVFHIDSTGKHGFVVAKTIQGTSIQWNTGNSVITNATNTGLKMGEENTARIVAAQGAGYYAANICDRLEIDGYDDWYLPSKEELELLYQLKVSGKLNSLTDDFYWSSTEASANGAWTQSFINGARSSADKQGTYAVCAIRAF